MNIGMNEFSILEKRFFAGREGVDVLPEVLLVTALHTQKAARLADRAAFLVCGIYQTSMISRVKGETEISLSPADILRGFACCVLRAVDLFYLSLRSTV